MWLRSYWHDIALELTWRTTQANLRLVRGHVAAGLFSPLDGFDAKATGVAVCSVPISDESESNLQWMISDEHSASDGKWCLGGFGFYLAGERVGFDLDREAIIPAWFVMIVCVIPVARRKWKLRSRPRTFGRCLMCLYNLTGKTSGICPECGTPVPKKPAEKSPRPA